MVHDTQPSKATPSISCIKFQPCAELADVEVVTTGRKRPPPQWLAEFLEDERRKSMPEGAKEDGTAVGALCWRTDCIQINLVSLTLVPVSEGPRRATVEEECPKCKHPTMHYWTMQMRSADEGQTVFFECPKCKYLYSTNT